MELNKPIKISVAKDKNYLEAVGIGNIVQSYVNDNKIKCVIKNVFYVPNLRKNLLSVRRLEMFNISVIFEKDKIKLFDGNRLVEVTEIIYMKYLLRFKKRMFVY